MKQSGPKKLAPASDLAAILGGTPEPVSEKIRVSDAFNVFLTKEIPLSDNAVSLGFWLAENSETGRADFLAYEEIAEAFPDAGKLELLEAVGELELSNLVSVSKAIGVPFRGIRTNFKLLEIFDPLVFEGVNPRIDASFIAKKLLGTDKTIGTKDICDETGWSVRRVNPALLIVGQYISDGRKSSPMV